MEDKILSVVIVLILIFSAMVCLVLCGWNQIEFEKNMIVIEKERLEAEKDYYEFQKQLIKDMKGDTF